MRGGKFGRSLTGFMRPETWLAPVPCWKKALGQLRDAVNSLS